MASGVLIWGVMKKSPKKPKLDLQTQQLRPLTAPELGNVMGGWMDIPKRPTGGGDQS